MGRTLIRTDKNGTKYYHVTCPCMKCGGQGYIKHFHYVEGGLCFDCNGSGVIDYEEKEYTEEYLKKLEERRRKAQEKKDAKRKAEADELNKAFFERNNFSAEGKTYVALGDSYSMRDKLKELGFRFNNCVGWMFPVKVDGIETLELSADDCYEKDRLGVYDWREPKKIYFLKSEQITMEEARDNDYSWEDGFSWEWKAMYLVHRANLVRESSDSESGYVGIVGDGIVTEVTLKRTTSWESSFGYRTKTMYMHIMEDSNGNVIVWKTDNGSLLFMPKGEENYKCVDTDHPFTIMGTIKEHTEYNGIKQTVLTRCKVSQKEGANV